MKLWLTWILYPETLEKNIIYGLNCSLAEKQNFTTNCPVTKSEETKNVGSLVTIDTDVDFGYFISNKCTCTKEISSN